jgi:hypothetical protein
VGVWHSGQRAGVRARCTLCRLSGSVRTKGTQAGMPERILHHFTVSDVKLDVLKFN